MIIHYKVIFKHPWLGTHFNQNTHYNIKKSIEELALSYERRKHEDPISFLLKSPFLRTSENTRRALNKCNWVNPNWLKGGPVTFFLPRRPHNLWLIEWKAIFSPASIRNTYAGKENGFCSLCANCSRLDLIVGWLIRFSPVLFWGISRYVPTMGV